MPKVSYKLVLHRTRDRVWLTRLDNGWELPESLMHEIFEQLPYREANSMCDGDVFTVSAETS